VLDDLKYTNIFIIELVSSELVCIFFPNANQIKSILIGLELFLRDNKTS